MEEKLKNGTVKGHYGYYDARGKLRTIKYLAQPVEGYEEKHHESNSLLPEYEWKGFLDSSTTNKVYILAGEEDSGKLEKN